MGRVHIYMQRAIDYAYVRKYDQITIEFLNLKCFRHFGGLSLTKSHY